MSEGRFEGSGCELGWEEVWMLDRKNPDHTRTAEERKFSQGLCRKIKARSEPEYFTTSLMKTGGKGVNFLTLPQKFWGVSYQFLIWTAALNQILLHYKKEKHNRILLSNFCLLAVIQIFL